jgi:hypothetical protein
MTERPWTDRDSYQLRLDEAGRIHCRRIRSQTRDVSLIAVEGVTQFATGPRAGDAGRALTIAVLADVLEASPRAEDYREPRGVEEMIWHVHRSGFARFFQPLRVKPGVFSEVDTSELLAWISVEFRAQFGVE